MNITPTEPLILAGYSGRLKPAIGVADRLEANALVLCHREATAVFVNCDLLFLGYMLRKELEIQIRDCVPADFLFTSATHTHFAPATDPALPLLGQASESYIAFVAGRISSLVRTLMQSQRRAVNVRYKIGEAHHAINRRLPVLRPLLRFPPWGTRWEMRPNPDVAVDEKIHILSFDDDNGQPIAICWCYACHPVCVPSKFHVSADFPGVVRDYIRKRFGNIPVLFWQGFSGDVRPKAIRLPSGGLLERWKLPAFAPFTVQRWEEWSSGLAACVLRAMDTPGRVVEGDLHAARRRIALSKLGPSSDNRDISVHEIRLGSGLSVFGVSAELMNAYVTQLEKTRPASTVIPVSCLDGVPGYIPTDVMVPQGGYEAQGFMRLFGISGRYREDVSTVVVRRIFSDNLLRQD